MEVLAVVEEEGNTWMTPIQEYLTEEILPVEADKERAVRRKSQRFALINGVLYKKSFLGPCKDKVFLTRASCASRAARSASHKDSGVAAVRCCNFVSVGFLSSSNSSIYSVKETQSCSAKDKSPSHPSLSTPMVGEMHKEAQQAAGGPTSLGATSKEGAHPQLNSGSDASVNSIAEVDPGKSAPNDSIPS
ncbi:hypothetical protein Tco_0412283 [Tanacetum coccineum]